MRSLQRYENYSDSGIPWVGEIPAHWRVKPTFAVADEKSIKNSDGNETTVLSLSYGKVIVKDIENNFGLLPESFDTYQLVFNGDIILRLTDLQNDKRSLRVGLSEHQGIITSAYLKLVCKREELLPNFAYRLLHSYDTTKVFYGMGGGLRQSMKFSDFRRLPILVPPLAEQSQIATFLDRETTKIDRLIEKQQRLIELLKEKRQAVISHAVTKGLNPDVSMKDSGVTWLGEVPAHWQMRKLKYIFQIRKRISGELGHDILAITQKGIRVKDIESGEGQLSMDYSKYQFVKIGDFAMNHMDLLTGWVDISKFNGVTSPDYRVFSLVDASCVPLYMLYLLQMGYKQEIFYAYGQGSSHLGRWRLPTEAFKNFIFPCPPTAEQQKIACFIENEHTRIDKIIDKCSKTIALLKERRTALISAAVTGKIDVRDQVQQDVEEAVAL